MRGTVAMIRNVGLSPPNAGACLVGQSMGAYMAIEPAKEMPKIPRQWRQARAADSPCTKAF